MKTIIESLSPRQRDWLFRQLLDHGREHETAITPHAPGQSEFPVSFGQQRLWFLDQLQPGSVFFNVPGAFRLKGELDVPALRATLDEVVRRHEALRTTFSTVEGRPVQVVAPELRPDLPVVECPRTAAPEEWVRRAMEAEAGTPFMLDRGPLIRAKLLKLRGDEHVVILNMHHIISDMWSAGVLVREVAVLYEAFRAKQPSPLPELKIQYADFAQWQRGWLQGARLEKQLSYWKERMQGGLEPLELPLDKPRPSVQTYAGAQHRFALSPGLTDRLKRLSQEHGATPFMVLLSGFKALLHRYTGQTDICVGTPVANRSRPELEELIGFFVNTLVLRTEVPGDATFAELLGRVRDTSLGAFAHQDLPFDQLVEALQPERDMSRTPLFQTLFVLQNAPMGELRLPGLVLEPITFDLHTADFDLTLKITEASGGLACTFEFNTDLFTPETVERWAGHFERLLEGAVTNPNQCVGELDLLGDRERRRLLVEWNDTAHEFPPNASIHDLFEAQVAKTPDAVAVVAGDTRFTYRELNARANQLAHALRGQGVQTENLVGLCVERSFEMVVGLLGILKAGAAYVPLDPQYPRERLAFIAKDAKLSVIVGQSSLADRVPCETARTLALDAASTDLAGLSILNPLRVGGGASAAYVIYTSGSTGTPKGAVITHRSAVAFLHWVARTFDRIELSAVLAVTSICFDLSIFEVFGPLSWGGACVLARDAMDTSALRSPYPVTLVNTVPSAMREWVGMGLLPATARTVNLAGEPLTRDLARRVYDVPTVARLCNLYGPTEDTTYSTFAEVRRGDARTPAIGVPLDNRQAYVLDRRLNLVPIGVAGEVWLSGVGLARGYVDRPEMTAEKFVPNPFGAPGARMYRTGDLARWRSDGNLECLGRIDHQVKVRGFRIELGEVEAAIRNHPSVEECVVVAREDASGDKRLVAYVVAATGATVDTPLLRESLRETLPEYMVPSAFVSLDALPLTPNGKIDRRALPAPQAAIITDSSERVSPRTEEERALAAIWAEVLRVDAVGIHDNFFEAGGHSLMVMQVVSRVRTAFGVDVSVREAFERPTVAMLAELLAGRGPDADETPLKAFPRTGPLPLSFAQQRLWFLDQLEPGSAFYNIPGALRLRGELDVAALRSTLDEVVRRHEALRTTFSMADGQPVQVVSPELHPDLPVVECPIAAAPEQWARAMIEEEARGLLPLDRGPLIRAKLLKLRSDEHVFVVNMHHIVSDGWSLGLLVREVAALYEAFRAGRPSPLPELEIQYSDFARWQREWLQGPRLEKQVAYWKEQLRGSPEPLELPLDKPRPVAQTYAGAQHRFELSSELTERLKRLSQEHGATLFMTLLAGFEALLHRLTGQTDICVGTPVANRSRPRLEGLIGFFVNTLVLRTEVPDQGSFVDLLKRVRDTALGAFANQDLPFEQLVAAIQPERDMSRTPLFQVLFALQNAPMGELHLSKLVLEPVTFDAGVSKFDLSLDATETDRGLSCAFEYNTDLFARETVERWVGHFKRLLESAVAKPSAQIGELDLLSDRERHQLLVDWNDTTREFPRDKTLVDLFEQQVAAHPDAVVVVFGDQRLTYAELNGRANQLAHHLRGMGVGAESLVALGVERSLEMIVGVLGILKAGGAYLPLDPTYPRERIVRMLADARPVALVAQKSLSDALEGCGVRGVCLDADEEELRRAPAGNPRRAAGPDNLAYVIYTSGSTGWPKGTLIPHRAVVNLVTAHLRDLYGPHEPGHLNATLNAPLSFDMSVSEMCALFGGHTLFVVPEEVRRSPEDLARFLEDQAIDAFECAPAQLKALIEIAGLDHLPRFVLSGGDALDADLWRRLQSCSTTVAFNTYGPTECTVDATVCRIDSSTPEPRIGRPEANVQVYVLDRYLNPVPAGVAGELCIGGEGLARGYLNQPELTADRFVPDPFSGRSGARLYRTGDLARQHADGQLEYVGRLDRQVKLRGFRIELGEVEAALRAHPAVKDAVVAIREDARGDRRLVAYCATEEGLRTDELRLSLGRRLPVHMIPAAFVLVPSIPLTPSGKVDRRALLSLEAPATDVALSAAAQPRDETERALAAIWAEVLRVEGVGIHDNFFEAGGHSLMVMQVVTRVRATLGVNVTVREVFERPTVAMLAECLGGRNRDAGEPALKAFVRRAPPPLSFAQQRLWFLDQLEPGSAFYSIPGALRIVGELDVAALRSTLDEVVRRHEALRTTFSMVDGQPVQVISPELRPNLPVSECPSAASSAPEEWVKREIDEEAASPFSLERGPLIRAKLLRLGSDRHVLVVNMHHIVSDGWSAGLLVREVAVLYEAFRARQPSPLPELEIQYADFAQWQREWLQGPRLEEQVAYWKKQLHAPLGALELPLDKPRPPVQSYAGAQHRFELSRELTAQLKRLAQERGATLFMTLLAGFKALLHRHTGQTDICVGTPIANRSRPELEALIGFFVNTLVLRTEVPDEGTFVDLLARVRETALGAFAHQDFPFEQLVEALQPDRDMSRTPFFQALFVLQNAPMGELRLPGLVLSPVTFETRTSKFDLTLDATETAGAISCTFEFNTDLFARESIVRWAGHLERLLQSAVSEPLRRVRDLEILSDDERHRVVAEWNEPARRFPRERTLVELFEAQVEAHPRAVAVVYEDESLTYGELNERANRLAHHLIALGVKPDARVAIGVERSLGMVVGLLAILKAGGAYVPLDPAYPKERLEFMLADSAPVALLTQSSLDGRWGTVPDELTVIDLDAHAEGEEKFSRANPDSRGFGLSADHLAYIIYTSGSTGKPKGVMVEHGNVARLMSATDAWFHFGPDDVWTLFHSYAFDFSVWEIWGALLYGGRLIVVPQVVTRSPGEFYRLLCGHEVTVLNQTPSAFRQLIAAQSATTPAERHRLRVVIFGGEALEVATLKPWYAQNEGMDTQLVNMYGITETTVHVTYRPLVPADTDHRGASPIGSRIPDLQTYILDGRREPVPIGVAGELYVGGAGVARGYLNRPELTAERFLRNPFVEQTSEELEPRMYKTGDLGRWLPDGAIEFIGRNDFQVKIRGFRIELGEIEAKLAGVPGVKDAVVLAREDDPGNKRLVAYYVGGDDLTAASLRSHLAGELPEYMVPGAYVRLDALPLTPNGKLDRKALPAPDGGSYGVRSYEAPVGEIEQTLARIWADLLKVDRVGRHDHFFELGGHSLLLVTVLLRVREALHVELTIRTLLEDATIAGLAAATEQALRDGAGASGAETSDARPACLVPFSHGPGAPLFCVHPAGGDVLCFAPLSQHLAGRPVFGLQSPGLAGERAPFTRVEDIAAHFVAAMRTVQPRGPYHITGWSLGAHVAFEISQQLTREGETVALLALLDADAAAGDEARKSYPDAPAFEDHAPWLANIAEYIEQLWGVRVAVSLDELKRLGPDAQVEAFVEALQKVRIPGAPTPTPAQVRRLLSVFKANMRALGDYAPQTYPGALTLVQAEGSAAWAGEARTGWSELSSKPMEVHTVPGDHYTLLAPPNVERVAGLFQRLLERGASDVA